MFRFVALNPSRDASFLNFVYFQVFINIGSSGPQKPVEIAAGGPRRSLGSLHQVDSERNLILIRGAVPGPRGRDVLIQSSVKSRLASDK